MRIGLIWLDDSARGAQPGGDRTNRKRWGGGSERGRKGVERGREEGGGSVGWRGAATRAVESCPATRASLRLYAVHVQPESVGKKKRGNW
eukprot:3932533-Rhodomonas_salina.2